MQAVGIVEAVDSVIHLSMVTKVTEDSKYIPVEVWGCIIQAA